MCHPATCRQCGKASWKGCGMHVDQVMAGVPKGMRCDCAPEDKPTGLLARMFGR